MMGLRTRDFRTDWSIEVGGAATFHVSFLSFWPIGRNADIGWNAQSKRLIRIRCM